MKFLMVGATGNYAPLIIPAAKRRGADARALVRDESKISEAKSNGAVDVVLGDLHDDASLIAAMDGVDAVFHLGPAFSPDESEMGVAMVQAARQSGVRKFVFSGAIHPSIDAMANHRNKRPVEEALYESNLHYVVLQPAMFMQTLSGAWPAILKTSTFGLPYSKHSKCCFVDFRDVAEVVAIALTTDRLDFGTFELSAAGMFDRTELTELMSQATGQQIAATEPSFEQWVEAVDLPIGSRRVGMKKMFDNYNEFGFTGGNDLVLKSILQRDSRTLADFFAELASRT